MCPEHPAPVDPSSLPPSDLPTLKLVRITEEERESTWLLNGQSWRGPLSLPAYLRREHHLGVQDLTRDGGITYWALVDSASKASPRVLLSTVETLKKRAIVALRDGWAEEITTHGVGSVFCREEYRRRGYAGRMMSELGKELETWQQEKGKRSRFTVLYSDIGKVGVIPFKCLGWGPDVFDQKEFYAKSGWIPFPSSHVSLPPLEGPSPLKDAPQTSPLYPEDLGRLCRDDEAMLRKNITMFPEGRIKARVALIPDVETMQWHHAREEFAAMDFLHKIPHIKGAISGDDPGHRAWCIWTRVFGSKSSTLHVLRLVIEGEDDFGRVFVNGAGAFPKRVSAAAACLRAAQVEAAKWDMQNVEIWNPSAATFEAARMAFPDATITHRDSESIASLMWYGPESGVDGDVEWVCNEKYGWC
jgi:GNAT superfamily N-acetyltransferase